MVPDRTQRANPARGLALIATAVIVGIFLLRNGFGDQGIPDIGTDETAAVSDTNGGDSSGDGGSTGTTAAPQPPPKSPADVTVRVANAAGVNGAAGEWTTTIGEAGYPTVEATNAQPNRETTAVLYTAGFEREAATLAEAIGAPADGIVALSEPPQVDPAGANLVVMLGTDLAGG
jgi:hypothetical protein